MWCSTVMMVEVRVDFLVNPFSARLPRPSCHTIQVEPAVYILSLAATYVWGAPKYLKPRTRHFHDHQPKFSLISILTGLLWRGLCRQLYTRQLCSVIPTVQDSDRELAHVNLPSLCSLVVQGRCHLQEKRFRFSLLPCFGPARPAHSTSSYPSSLESSRKQYTCF